MFLEHGRFKVVSEFQHRYEHSFSEFAYTHDALPNTVQDAQAALDYVFNVLYPKVQPSVANVAALPAAGNSVGDQRIVQDDGDGKAALYMWSKFDGQIVEQWNKIADVDWGVDSVISALMDQTQYLYTRKFGITDYNPVTEVALTGDNAGQHLYGGDLINQNLVLHANNGDGVGTHTGAVFFDDPAKPLEDLTHIFGDGAHRWLNGYFGTLTVGTATLTITDDGADASISTTSTNNQILFGANNLVTTGNINGTILTGTTSLVAGNLTLSNGSIVSSSGAINFGDENLSTSGTLLSGIHTVTDGVDTLIFDADLAGAGTQSSINSSLGLITFNGDNLTGVGTLATGQITADSLVIDATTYDNNAVTTAASNYTLNPTGNLILDPSTNIITINDSDIVGLTDSSIAVDTLSSLGLAAISINDNTISSLNADIIFSSNITPSAATIDLGKTGAANGFRKLYMQTAGGIQDSTNGNEITMATLASLRSVTAGAADGDAIFWDAATSTFLASNPDTEIQHELLTGLTTTDAGHTQFAMLAGRAVPQTINGGALTTEKLSLIGNSVDGNGLIIGSSIDPTGATIDLGAVTAFRDLYMSGQGIGFRAQNDADPTTNITKTVGRLAFNTASGFLEVSDGTTWNKVGNNSYNNGTFNQTTIIATHIVNTVTAFGGVDDARNCIWQVCDINNGEEVMGLKITKIAASVTVSVDSPLVLPNGNFRLMGIEV